MLVGSATRNGRITAIKRGYEDGVASVYLDDADVQASVSLRPK